MIKEVFNRIINDKRFKLVIISGFVIALIAHAMMFSNQLSLHDDVAAFNGYGTTYRLGRWSLGLMEEWTIKLWGSNNVSTHTFYGVLTILSLLLTAYIFIYFLDIKNNASIIILSGLFVTFPAVTEIFAYMFTAWPYYLGVLLGVIGAVIWFKKKSILSFIISTLLMAIGTGFYQANVPVFIASIVLFMMIDIYKNDNNWIAYIKNGLLNIFTCLSFMIEYYVINQYFVKTRNIEVDHKMNDVWTTGIKQYIKRIMLAYKEFIKPTNSYSGGVLHFLGITD